MLKEIQDVKQIVGEPRRRWFSSELLDLYVWYDDANTIVQFQICYDKGANEGALTWNKNTGFLQQGVDDGESGIFHMKSSPILISDEHPHSSSLLNLFAEAGQKLEHDLYEFVITRLRDVP